MRLTVQLNGQNVLLVCAAVFGFLGLWALISPEGLVAVLGIRAEGTDAVADLRAMYGGMELAWAAILLWHAAEPERVRPGLVLCAVAIGSLGASRLLSQLLTEFTALSAFLAASELGTAALCLWVRRDE